MISAVAFCPQAPVVVPQVAQGAAAELDDLRAACRAAIAAVAAPGRQLVLVGAGPDTRAYPAATRGTLAPFGVPLEVPLGSDEPGPVQLPPALTVGAWLLADALGPGCGALGCAVGPDAAGLPGFADDDVALVVVGDGSARRSTTAPGYLDERAAPFDAAVAEALRRGDPAGLRVDAGLGAELLAAGTPAWRAVGELLAGTHWDARLLYDDAPYGVGYLVAVWTARA